MPEAMFQVEESLLSDARIRLLGDRLFAIRDVESLHLSRSETTIDVWVVIPKRDIDAVRRIAETERELMSHFISHQSDHLLYFDFHTVYRESNRVEELVPPEAIAIEAPGA